MKEFRTLTAGAAVLDRADVDTDQIIPKQFLKRIERTGYGEYLFHDWRKDPSFELNHPGCEGARILVAGANFACGSSREHAAWALQDYGFEVVVAPSFGDIFYSNATQIGLVPIVLSASEVKSLMQRALEGHEVSVDLEAQTVGCAEHGFSFEMDPFVRHSLINGLDPIGWTLQYEPDIATFEARRVATAATTAL